MTTSGTRTPAWAAISVASASCSTCSRRPTGALRRGSRYASRRHRRANRCVSWASRPRTRTRTGRPSRSWPAYAAEPISCRARGRRSSSSTPTSEHRLSNLRRRRDSGRRAEHQSHERAGAESQRHRAQHVGRQRRLKRELADAGRDDEPREKGPDGPDELGPDDCGDRDGRCEPVLREAPSRPQVVVDGQPVRADDAADDAARRLPARRARARRRGATPTAGARR